MTNKATALRRNLLHLMAFLLPSVVLLVMFRALGFYPFGEKSLLIMDMNGQYIHFFASLKDLVSGDSSLFFSWSKGMGQNYIGLFAYYLASPLSFITLLFDNEALPLGILLLTILKISLCGLTFSIYLSRAFDENRTFKLFFTTCYALMSYNLVYSLSLMWLDGVIYLPIILLGIESIIKGKKPVLFIVSITLMFLSNYYIAYSVAIFCVLYYFYRWFSLNRMNNGRALVRNLLKMALSALAGIGLSVWLLIPTVLDLATRGRGYQNSNTFNFSFWDIIKKFIPWNYDSITNSGLPAIFCGIGVLLLAIAFFFNKEIRPKVRLMAVGIFAVFLLSFWIVPVDEFWHGMQAPNWFPYRYAFLFSFFLILTAYFQFRNMEFSFKPCLREGLAVFLILLLCVNLYFNSVAMIEGLDRQFGYKDVSEYQEFYWQTEAALSNVPTDQEMCRIEKDFEYSKNDALLLGYNGISHYSSTHISQLNTFTSKLGFTQGFLWNSHLGSSPVTDSLFNVKYILAKNAMSKLNTPLGTYDGVTLYRNDFCLPIGFAVQGEQDGDYQSTRDPFVNQNMLLNALSGLDGQVFRPIEFGNGVSDDGSEVVYYFTAQNKAPVYLYMRDGSTYAHVRVNGDYVAPYFSNDTTGVLYIGSFSSGEAVQIAVRSNNSEALDISEVYLYEVDSDYFAQSIGKLRAEGFYDTQQVSNGLNAWINTDSSRVCFTSIPYAKGFTVKVNGQETESFAYADTFLAFPVPAGESSIEIRFVSPGFYIGLIVSLLTAVILLSVWIVTKQKQKRACKSL
ncbi:MAG: YfhO family protein [Clostridia bacterium]|nr:YfhO family protein [Clostridia bacterium]